MLKYAIFPNGNMHIGNLYEALLNYIVANQNSDSFLFSIEDLDKNKIIEGSDAQFIDILKKFSIDTEQKIYQSEKLKTYQQFAKKMVQNGSAFLCFCKKEGSCECLNLTQEDMQNRVQDNQEFAIKVNKPSQNIEFSDTIKNSISFTPEQIGNFTIVNSNKIPTQELADAVDSMSTNITTIITCEDKQLNSAKILHIQNLLGYTQQITYAHTAGFSEEDKNAFTIKSLFEQGFLPDAIINYILSINYPTPKELFYLPDAINWYDISKISNTKLHFSIEDLKKINKKHLVNMDSKKLSSIFGFADNDIGELLKLYLDNVSTINELEDIFKSIFGKKDCTNKDANNVKMLSDIILKAPMINNYDQFEEYLIENSSLSKEQLTKPLKYLLTGRFDGPELEVIFPLIKSYILEVARCH
jgi:glutamyl-tRNA synthetase